MCPELTGRKEDLCDIFILHLLGEKQVDAVNPSFRSV